jgi:hypothetical protein
MSTQTNAQPATATGIEDHRSRPYKDYSLDDLIEMLEHQHEQQQPFNELMYSS